MLSFHPIQSSIPTPSTLPFMSLRSEYWSVECLRNSNCTLSSNRLSKCQRFLRCSTCKNEEFACQLINECIHASRVCNGKVDCKDASDELGCENLEW